MSKEKSCPCCGHKVIKYDERTRELYCNHCGLILDDNSYIEDNHEWETSHEPLSDGLSVQADMAKIERKYNYKSSSKNKYDKFKSRYLPILEDKLIDIGYNYSEALDIFNTVFKKFYELDTNSNSPIVDDDGKKHQRSRAELVDDFIESVRFDEFDVTACVSSISKSDTFKQRGSTIYY